MNISALFSPVASFLQASFLRLSALDGKAGLTLADFQVVLGWVTRASDTLTDNAGKAAMVKDLITSNFGSKVPSWLIDVLVWIAYAYAKRKGLV